MKLPERMGQMEERPLRGVGARGGRLREGGLGVLLEDTLQLCHGSFIADTFYLPVEGVRVFALLKKPLRHDALGLGLRGGAHETRPRRTKYLHAADVGVLAVQVVTENIHLEHKQLNRAQGRRGTRGARGLHFL